MSLVSFHRFLIMTAIAFCFGYAFWEFNSALEGRGGPAFVVGTIFIVLGFGLGFYLRHLGRFLGYRE